MQDPEMAAAALREVAAPDMRFIYGTTEEGRNLLLVESGDGVVLTVYDLDIDLSGQVEEDTCSAHRAYLCPLCFAFTPE